MMIINHQQTSLQYYTMVLLLLLRHAYLTSLLAISGEVGTAHALNIRAEVKLVTALSFRALVAFIVNCALALTAIHPVATNPRGMQGVGAIGENRASYLLAALGT